MPISWIARIALIAGLLTGTAHAEFPRDWYVSAGVGWNYAASVTLDPDRTRVDLDRGLYQPTVAVGVKLREHWRVELGGSIVDDTGEMIYSSSAGIEADSDPDDLLEASSLMVNVLRDIPIGIAWRPYLGVGVGMSRVDFHLSEIGVDNESFQRPRRDIVNDRTTTFTYQLIAGFSVPISRRLDLSADYRFLRSPSAELEDVSGRDFDIDYGVHSAWLHLRYHGPDAGVFSTPPPRRKSKGGFYLSTSFGGGFSEDAELKNVPTRITIDAFDLGPTATIAAGYEWGKRWRVELEGGYRRNEVEVIDFRLPQGEDAASGQVRSYSLMANVIYHFAPGSSIRPFVGLGAGIMSQSYDVEVFGFCEFYVCGSEHRAQFVDDKDATRAIQAMVGVEVAVSPQLTFSADYRHLRTSELEMQAPDGSPFVVEEHRNTSIVVGLRYSIARER